LEAAQTLLAVAPAVFLDEEGGLGLLPGPLIRLGLSWGLQLLVKAGREFPHAQEPMENVKAEPPSVSFHDFWFALKTNTRAYS